MQDTETGGEIAQAPTPPEYAKTPAEHLRGIAARITPQSWGSHYELVAQGCGYTVGDPKKGSQLRLLDSDYFRRELRPAVLEVSGYGGLRELWGDLRDRSKVGRCIFIAAAEMLEDRELEHEVESTHREVRARQRRANKDGRPLEVPV